MNYPWWKSVLSYIVDLPIRKWRSEYNEEMELSLSRGELKLSTANAVYSFGTNYRSFAYAFELLDIFKNTSVRSVLVLGWGMGSIADLLEGHPSIVSITAIEHDETLIDCFREADEGNRSMNLEIVCADAVEFVKHCQEEYDIVCSDVFIDNKTPEVIISEDYLRDLTKVTSPGGLCLLSKMSVSVSDRDQNQEFESNLRSLGIDFKVLNTIGNRMYHWSR